MEFFIRFGLMILFLSVPILLAVGKRYSSSIVVCFLFAVVSFLAMEVKVFAFYLAAIPLLFVLRRNEPSKKITAAACAAWAACGIVGSVLGDLREFRERHTKYPLESLTDCMSLGSRCMPTTLTVRIWFVERSIPAPTG